MGLPVSRAITTQDPASSDTGIIQYSFLLCI
jgi:hypothetical protein